MELADTSTVDRQVAKNIARIAQEIGKCPSSLSKLTQAKKAEIRCYTRRNRSAVTECLKMDLPSMG